MFILLQIYDKMLKRQNFSPFFLILCAFHRVRWFTMQRSTPSIRLFVHDVHYWNLIVNTDWIINKLFVGFDYLLYLCHRNRIHYIIMATATMEHITLEVPSFEVAFLRTLSKKMGWTMKRQRKSGIQQALDDVEAGRVYEANSVEDLMSQLNS